MNPVGRAVVFVALLTPAGLAAQPVDLDEQRAAWPYRRAVTVSAAESTSRPAFVALVVPPEVGARSQPDLRDLRLVEAEGREVQYVVDRAIERVTTPRWTGRLADTLREPKTRSVWVVDLGESRTFDSIWLDIRQSDFAKRVRVEVSTDAQRWRLVREDAGVFDRPWTARVHHTTIALSAPLSARYLRLTADDRRSAPVDVYGVVVEASRRILGAVWRRPAGLVSLQTRPGVSRYRLALPPRFPIDVVELETDEPAFSRRVVLSEVREVNDRQDEVPLGDGTLYRIRLDDEALAGNALALPIRRPQGGELILEVHDEDSPPLRGIRASVSGAVTRLLFPVTPGPLTLYYGNDATRGPLYDLESLKGHLGLSPTFGAATLGAEEANSRFRRMPPLPFAAPRGVTVAVAHWQKIHRLTIADREDLYTLILSPEDLAVAGPKFGDLRIVDESDRQVPYALEPAASAAPVAMTVERTGGPSRSGGGAVSRYRLTVRSEAPRSPLALPIWALELTFQEEFFTRRIRLFAPPPPHGHDTERHLYTGPLERRADVHGSIPPGPIVLNLSGMRERELFLDIDEGDNTPLTLVRAEAVVRVPRVAFKAAPGQYRLLVGNDQVEPPRYDIASLQQEMLSYSAVAVHAGPIEPNPAFRRQARDYVRSVSPSLLLWGTLVGAVSVLLLLTVRILKVSPNRNTRDGYP